MAKKILLADDSLTIQKVVELTLSGTDYELTSVSNGRKALESLAASRPDLILADVVMPEKNGYEVCEAVKGNPETARIPVVLLSGTFEPFDRERADRIGCDMVVSKPFDSHQLLERIDALLARTPSPSREEQAPFETAFLDDTVPSGRPVETADADNPFGRGEEAPAPTPPGASPEPPPPERHPVEDATVRMPPPEPPSPPAPSLVHEVAVEEISAEAAEVLFDLPYEFEPAPAAAPAPAAPVLTDDQIDRIATRVVEKLSDRIVREIAWEVVPEMAEMVVKRRIKELEGGAE